MSFIDPNHFTKGTLIIPAEANSLHTQISVYFGNRSDACPFGFSFDLNGEQRGFAIRVEFAREIFKLLFHGLVE